MFGVRAKEPDTQVLNLLVVPFPFRISGGCFRGGDSAFGEDRKSKFFSLNQTWLRQNGRPISPRDLANFLRTLVQEAEREVGQVHGLILPEGALRESDIRPIAQRLAQSTRLELLVSGFLGTSRGTKLQRNGVYTGIFHRNRILTEWTQSKHHRWKLDQHQIRRYNLGDALDLTHTWWEGIALEPRTCTFYVFRHGASLTALVCEDLARIDPVQTALRAVGPNLVVVLLMDGPQWERRWPGRYAILADDPGSSVLTLTSFGLVRRSVMPGDEEPREIALWKEPTSSDAKELRLPKNSHGVLLSLTYFDEEPCYSLDGRSDRGATVGLSLSAARGISHPKPPSWVQ